VLLLQGRLGHYEGEYSAISVKTQTGLVYLAEAVEDMVSWQGSIMTIQFHIATEPLNFYELEENLVKTAMGNTTAKYSHAYSDLTGCLWTNEEVKVDKHDILREICSIMSSMKGDKYIAFRAEKKS